MEKIIVNDYIENEPLSEENLDKTLNLIHEFRLSCPNKTIWLYTGYQVREVDEYNGIIFNRGNENIFEQFSVKTVLAYNKRSEIVRQCDVLVDGRYIDSQRNPSKKWAGSDNQRVIDIQKSLEQNKIVLYCD